MMKTKTSVQDDFLEEDSVSSAGKGENDFTTTGSRSEDSVEGEDDLKAIKEALTREETKAVFRLRILVLSLLILAASAVTYTVYHIIYAAQVQDFENNYIAVSEKIAARLNEITNSLPSVARLGVTFSQSALKGLAPGEEPSWPFVTLEGFQDRAITARALSGSLYLSVNPILNTSNFEAWDEYVLSDANSWINEGLEQQEQTGLTFDDAGEKTFLTNRTVDPMHVIDDNGNAHLSDPQGPVFVPRWQTSPVIHSSNHINEDISQGWAKAEIETSIATKSVVLGGFHYAPPGNTASPDSSTRFFATLLSMWRGEPVEYEGDPISHIILPIFDRPSAKDRNVVGVLKSTIQWRYFLQDILASSDIGYQVAVKCTCMKELTKYTFELNGPKVKNVGINKRHDDHIPSEIHFDATLNADIIEDGTTEGVPFLKDYCPYIFEVYPSHENFEYYVTNQAIVISLSIAAVFVFTILMFVVYDRLVERRQRIVLAKATHSTAIVSSLFPKQVHERLLAVENDKKEKRKGEFMMPGNHKIKTFLNGGNNAGEHSDPIADLFPHCTVMFADIADFTAWSSSREPSQVFVLLQAVYQSFDTIAKRRKVFKVETIGDCYVAVAGLPEAQLKHATIMAKFAWECLHKMGEVTKSLENRLGPDTADLMMRFGLHSGPVTAGVLKGERARFQLFGDTVNTAARMESTGQKGLIQVSSSTAALLRADRHGQWVSPRADVVAAKGKGVLSTYWLNLTSNQLSRTASIASLFTGSRDEELSEPESQAKDTRLTEWIADLLIQQIKKLVIVRERCSSQQKRRPTKEDDDVIYKNHTDKICLDEVQQAISTPDFNRDVTEAAMDSNSVKVPTHIVKLVEEYVFMISKSYHSTNAFHNFQHACHVTMSVSKLLGRVVTPDLSSMETSNDLELMTSNHHGPQATHEMAAKIHDYTHGLTSDPMASFALIFSALIHDADHQGISNMQLAKEEPELAIHYRHKSVAEQNSLDIAWDILMSSRFEKLRQYVFGTKQELLRFRQLLVNIVLATDIFDKELNQLRKDRWQKAFHEGLDRTATKDLRATIVMEHIMQASDVSHTMQHWHVYQKWNRCLFLEMRQAYQTGRMEKDPATFWYQGELGFFDNYIIPLAKKLKECGVFGVSSDEYLNYALKNREEWEHRGKDIVNNLIQEEEEE